ncbi:MAG: molecular chaperone HtpG [Paludibacteraceae bacterium]|nr:molecular chaperone HtpG [Paludibacteraceae bacterium]
MERKGSIDVTTANIFPVIKKFLYSDHEIFLREIVSNAVDASQKLKTLSSVGEFKGELGELKVAVKIDKAAGTLTISDNGIGMTQEEIDKYINQIAFSGAEEFVNKYKDAAQAIIGHFGLGFYSSFMVSKRVDIITKSYKEGSQGVKWTCDGNPEFEFSDVEKAERGTDIVMHIDDENKDFLEESKISDLLNKYCKFLPVPIVFGKKKEWKDGKEVETDEDNVINNPTPAWTRKPADLKEEDYSNFYRELYPYAEDPLFHIHLNVDYPFNLTGILYFPKIRNNFEVQKNKIQLYCNQVFVTDSVENIVPEFLTLLHGVIDSPDIPLNVSRSYLQADQNVKKISGYITKKVAERLEELFKTDRAGFEGKWDDLKLFIEYGILSDEKFAEKADKFVLLKDSDKKYYTLEEYKNLIEPNQKDKDGNLVYLYANNLEEQYACVQAAKEKGYNVLFLDGPLDNHFINRLEQKSEGKARYVRVDSDTIDRLIKKEDEQAVALTINQQNALRTVFESLLPKTDKMNFSVAFENVSGAEMPVQITLNEFMRRMKEMSAMQGGGMNFYGQMPDSYSFVLNVAHPLVKDILNAEEAACGAKVNPLIAEAEELEQKKKNLKGDKKDEDIPQEVKDEIKSIEQQLAQKQEAQKAAFQDFAANNEKTRQLVDLALLSSNLLKGEAMNQFIKRSIKML